MDCSLSGSCRFSIQMLLCSASCTIDLRNLRNQRGKEKLSRNYSHADFADLADFLFRYYYAVHECTIDPRNLRGKQKLSGNYSHADLADLADFLFRYYYVVHECTTDLRNLRNQRGKEKLSVDILTQISRILQIFIQILLCMHECT